MYFSDTDIRKIKDIADDKLLEVVQDFKELRRSGASYTCKCPRCGSDTKFTITPDCRYLSIAGLAQWMRSTCWPVEVMIVFSIVL